MYNVTVPSGIGDVSWIYSKLCHADKPIWFEVADGWPYRTAPFLELLPNVAVAKYSDVNYTTICVLQGSTPSWKTIVDRRAGMIYLEANQHLERGKRLEEWLPDLPTDFHYPIPGPSLRDLSVVNRLLHWETLPRPLIGISAASYRGHRAWNTWGYDQWSPFLKALTEETGGTVILLGGFWDDLTHELTLEGYLDIVGKTNIPQAIEVLRRLDHYVGFASGLGILRTVLSKSAYMLFPSHLEMLMTSWAPPEMLESHTYDFSVWDDPKLIFPRVIEHLEASEISKIEKSCPTSSQPNTFLA